MHPVAALLALAGVEPMWYIDREGIRLVSEGFMLSTNAPKFPWVFAEGSPSLYHPFSGWDEIPASELDRIPAELVNKFLSHL